METKLNWAKKIFANAFHKKVSWPFCHRMEEMRKIENEFNWAESLIFKNSVLLKSFHGHSVHFKRHIELVHICPRLAIDCRSICIRGIDLSLRNILKINSMLS